MTPQDFVTAYKPYADRLAAQTRLSPWLFLAQFAVETGWGASDLAANCHNLAGIRPNDQGLAHPGVSQVPGPFLCYPNLDTFGANYLEVINHSDYDAVRATAGRPLWDQMAALGAAPWDAGHYVARPGAGQGSALGILFDQSLKSIAGESPTERSPDKMQAFTLKAGDHVFIPGVNKDTSWNVVSQDDDAAVTLLLYDVNGTPIPAGTLPRVIKGNLADVHGPQQIYGQFTAILDPGGTAYFKNEEAGGAATIVVMVHRG